MSGSPSLRDIARLAGVSHVAVSLALRGHPGVSKVTAVRIRRLAARMGYRPDPEIARLMNHLRTRRPAKRQGVIAWISMFKSESSERSVPTNLRIIDGASRQADLLGYNIELFDPPQNERESRHLERILLTRGIRGVLLGPVRAAHVRINLDCRSFATVSVGYSVEEPSTHIVAHDHHFNASLATEKLIGLGYRRPGLVLPLEDDERTERRWSAGYLSACQYLLPPRSQVKPCLYVHESDVISWFKRHKPDALLLLNDLPMHFLAGEGIHVRQDFAYALLSFPPEKAGDVAGIDQLPEQAGRNAVNLLAGCLARNEIGLPEHPLLVSSRGRWLDGDTAAPRP